MFSMMTHNRRRRGNIFENKSWRGNSWDSYFQNFLFTKPIMRAIIENIGNPCFLLYTPNYGFCLITLDFFIFFAFCCAKGLRQKVWTRTKILSPNIRYYIAILRFVAINTLFGSLLGKKVLFRLKNSFSWARSAL